METGLLWRQVVTDLHARDYADVSPTRGVFTGSYSPILRVEVTVEPAE